jgi:hypothetical protein
MDAYMDEIQVTTTFEEAVTQFVVPEPSTAALVLLALMGRLLFMRRRFH